MKIIGSEPHQSVIDALSAHVIRGDLSKQRAIELVLSISDTYPSGSNDQVEAILFQIRKDEGLAPPTIPARENDERSPQDDKPAR